MPIVTGIRALPKLREDRSWRWLPSPFAPQPMRLAGSASSGYSVQTRQIAPNDSPPNRGPSAKLGRSIHSLRQQDSLTRRRAKRRNFPRRLRHLQKRFGPMRAGAELQNPRREFAAKKALRPEAAKRVRTRG